MVRAGETDKALALLEQAARSMPREPRAWLQLGLAQIEAEQHELALETLGQMLKLAPGHPGGLLYSALASLELDQQDQVDEWLARLRKVCPGNQILPSFQALVCLRRAQPDGAAAALELPPLKQSPVWSRPELLPAGPFIGRLLAAVERWLLPFEVPELDATSALQDPPPLPDPDPMLGPQVMEQFQAWFWQGRGMRSLEQSFGGTPAHRSQSLDRSITSLQKANLLFGQLFRGRYNLGEALLYSVVAARSSHQLSPPVSLDTTTSQLHEALACFEASWAQDGPNPYLFYYLARSSFMLGRLDAAREYFERATKLFAKLSEAHYGLGQCAVLQGDFKTARLWLCKAAFCDLQAARERLFELGYRVANGELTTLPPLPELVIPPPVAPVIEEAPDADTEPSEESPLPHPLSLDEETHQQITSEAETECKAHPQCDLEPAENQRPNHPTPDETSSIS